MTSYGHIQNTLQDGNVRSVFYKSTDNVYVQKIRPCRKSEKMWKCRQSASYEPTCLATEPQSKTLPIVPSCPSISSKSHQSNDVPSPPERCSLIFEKQQGSGPLEETPRNDVVVVVDDDEANAADVERN